MFQRIVVPTDFSDCSQEAWSMAKRLGAVPGSELILAHVLTEIPRFGEGFLNVQSASEIEAAARKWATASLEDWIAEARVEGLTARATLRSGVPYQEIVGLARDERADDPDIRCSAFARHDIHDRAAGHEHVEGRISACGGNCTRPQAGVIEIGGLLQVLHLAASLASAPSRCPRTRSASTSTA